MRVLGVRDALGGRWASSSLGWVILIVPSFALVIVQESGTPFVHWSLIPASAVAQHLASGIVIGASALALRRRFPIIPIPLVAVMWVITGVARGLISGYFVVAFSGRDPQYAYRIFFWVGAVIVWVPLFTYGLAQLENRRRLLDAVAIATRNRDVGIERANKSAQQLRAHLVSTVQDAISPVIAEIRRSLSVLSGDVQPTTLRAISDRLGTVSADAARIVRDAEAEPLPTIDDQTISRRTPILMAIDFDLTRPYYAAVLTGIALAPSLIAEQWRDVGPLASLEIIAVLALVVAVLGFMFRTLHGISVKNFRVHLTLVVCSYLIAGTVGSIAHFLSPLTSHTAKDNALTILFPIAVCFASACISAAVGFANTNLELTVRLETITEDGRRLHAKSAASERRAKKQLAALLHGPVQGRLSACAMALNFHANAPGKMDPTRTGSITSSVLEHLDAASRDLDALTES